MKEKTYYKRFRTFVLWGLIATIIYCWNRPHTFSIVAVMYGIFLIFNRYYCYLEEREAEKKRLGKYFQKDKFYEQYMKQKRSLIRMEMMILVMLFFVLQYHMNK